MLDLLETSSPCDKEEKADVIFCDLVKIKRALDYSIEREMEHEFIFLCIYIKLHIPPTLIPKDINQRIIRVWNT